MVRSNPRAKAIIIDAGEMNQIRSQMDRCLDAKYETMNLEAA